MIKFIRAKSILTKYKEADSWFGIKYSMNLYRGCQHQCIYCDARSECYQIENFNDSIIIKENSINLLKKELSKLKEINTIGTGAMNDPYTPIEKKYQLTRQALETISLFNFPVHVITKSDMVLRDTDLLLDIGRTYSAVTVSITTIDDKLSKKIEPHAPVSSQRFEAINQLSNSGIYVGVALMPTLPFITDSPENILAIVEKAKKVGAQYIIASFGMTLRDKQKGYYFKKIQQLFSEEYSKYKKYYKGEYDFRSSNSNLLYELFKKSCSDNFIPTKMKLYTPSFKQLNMFS
jgi:DNA repair photolyase